MEGFGRADERRERTAGMAIVAGMAMDAKGDTSSGGGAKRSFGASSHGSATSSIGSQGSGEPPAKNPPTPQQRPALRRTSSHSPAK